MRKRTVLTALALSFSTVATGTGFAASSGASAKGASEQRDGLERFRQQKVGWGECRDKQLARSGTECARVVVPLDYSDPGGRTLEIAISRIKAKAGKDGKARARRGILQTNPGGPGGPGLSMPAELRERLSPEVAAAYDIIGMDHRGVGESTPLDCGRVRATWIRSSGSDRAGFEESVRLARQDARKCAEKYSGSLRHYSTRNIARDVDIVRAVLGERRTSWFGQSYGTVLGATYAQMFPGRVDRLVLDSAPDPAKYGTMRIIQDLGPANEKALDEFAAWAARRHEQYRLGATPAAVRGTVEGLVRRAMAEPVKVGPYRLDGYAALPLLLFDLVVDAHNDERLAEIVRYLLDAADGKPGRPHPYVLDILKTLSDPVGSGRSSGISGQLAVLCADSALPRDPEWYWKAIERSRAGQPVFGPVLNGPLPCAFWKDRSREKPTEINNKVPALQLQATVDTRTPYEEGIGMHRAMRGSVLVTVPARTHAVVVSRPGTCADKAVDDYLLRGALPARDITCRPAA
ncbi:alpha/beta hydrolase [Streptomyces sp. NPDC046261]|uniref:alpha/beta hydrolase n=1 Tax=Streptomyces sp. NPDC046261 TaxID=3157200 RepID=UPI0033C9ACE3